MYTLSPSGVYWDFDFSIFFPLSDRDDDFNRRDLFEESREGECVFDGISREILSNLIRKKDDGN